MGIIGTPALALMKWFLFIVNLVSCVYILVIFIDYLSTKHAGDHLSIPFMFNCIVGLLVSFYGFYGAWIGDPGMLMVYAVILIVNLIVGSFGGVQVFPVNLALYALCIIAALVYAFVASRNPVVSRPAVVVA